MNNALNASALGLKHIIGLLAVCATIVATVYWWPIQTNILQDSARSSEAPKPQGGDSEIAPSLNRPVVVSDEVSVVAAVPMASLPDPELPLSDQLPALLQRAKSGDPTASCRLIVSMNRCREEQRNREFTDKMVRSLEVKPGNNDNLLVGLVASSQETQEKKGGYCNGIDTRTLPQPEELFQKALHSFTPRQKTVLAMMRSDGSIRRVSGRASYSESGLYIIPQFLADNTVDFLLSGYAAKDVMALEGLVMLHSPGNALVRGGVSVWLPNPKLFLQYSLLMLDLFGPESIGQSGIRLMQVTSSAMTPEQLTEIRGRVQAEAADWRRFTAANPRRSGWELSTAPELAFKACTE